jgi:polysaccharide export outer membrane protein
MRKNSVPGFGLRQFLFLALLLLAFRAIAQTQPPIANVDNYRIGPEDVLEISVWKEDDLQKQALVRPDGRLSFPLIGEIDAAGKSVRQVTEEITEQLTNYLSNPVVSVGVLSVSSNKIYVIGKVNQPGEFASGRYINVMQALTKAGGLNPYAKSGEILILRSDTAGATTSIPFDYERVIAGKDLEQNIRLQNGDVVVVP